MKVKKKIAKWKEKSEINFHLLVKTRCENQPNVKTTGNGRMSQWLHFPWFTDIKLEIDASKSQIYLFCVRNVQI